MARPKKNRNICSMPVNVGLKPLSYEEGISEIIEMSIDEYETIRLIDLSGMTQEECALNMGIARTTVQSIYLTARQKLADCLINSKCLSVAGGDITICSGENEHCVQKNCKSEAR
ncbi:MAG: DUF134 domain-containing protein [Anaerotignaceae bacterium]